MMKKTQSVEKPRAVSDSSGKKPSPDQDQTQSRTHSLTDVFAVFSKKAKVSKKDASTNTTPLHETYERPTAPPPLPPKINYYRVNAALDRVDVNYEVVYNTVAMETKTKSAPWRNIKQENTRQEKNEEDSDDDSDEDSDGDALEETDKTTTTHKRNTSGWSLGSFHIDAPLELMNELLKEEEWAKFLENHVQSSPDTILSVSNEPNGKKSDIETERETTEDAADDKSTEKTKSTTGSNIDDIMKSVTIIEEKQEQPKVVDEREPPQLLPPKLTATVAAGINKQFRSSVFYKYKLPPPGQTPAPETPKSAAVILDKIKAKLKKSSVEELKESEK